MDKKIQFSVHLKLFDTALMLKYNQGHWKWYEWVKLNVYATIMQWECGGRGG